MMKTKLVSVAALLLVLVMCFAACSNSGNNKSAEIVTEDVGEIGGQLEDGTYTLVGMYDKEGKEFTSGMKIVNGLKEKGMSTDLIVNGDKIQMMETEYTLQDGKLVGEEDTLSYAVKDGRVTVFDEEDSSRIVFEK